MSQPAPGTLAWFEVATSDPDGAQKFYGNLFDWTFEADAPAASGGLDYRNIKASGAAAPMGGIFGTGGQLPDHAVFYILVADVEATWSASSSSPVPGRRGSPTCVTRQEISSASSPQPRADGARRAGHVPVGI